MRSKARTPAVEEKTSTFNEGVTNEHIFSTNFKERKNSENKIVAWRP